MHDTMPRRRSGTVTATVTPPGYVALVGELTISLLGTPRIEVDGRPLRVDTRKAVALLAYLAVTGRPARREALADLLWPGYEPANARAALRRTLSALNSGLGGRWLSPSRDAVELGGEGVQLDVARFRELLAHGRADEAVALYRGDFLDGFGLRDSADFDLWQLAESQSLRRELGTGLEEVALAEAGRGNLGAAIAHASRRLELDPLAESGHRLLIRLYAWAGDRAAAIEQYRACVRALHRELGVAPLGETTELYEQVSAGKVVRPAAPAPAVADPARAAPSLPFVGRDTELASLLAAWRSAAPDGRLLVIEGEAGIGKTRLADELVALVASSGAVVAVARAAEAESELSHAVVLELLRQLTARRDTSRRVAELPPAVLADASRLVPELAELRPGLPPATPSDSPGAASRFVAALADVLTFCSAGAVPSLVVVDDAQWADAASLEVLGYLVRRLRGRPLCLLLAWRSDEVSSGHALRELVADARRTKQALVVAPARLDRASVTTLARAAGAEPDADRLYAQTAGLPLFVVEYLATRGDGSPGDVPDSVADLLRDRAAAVGEGARQVLAAAAVLGTSFDLDAVRETSGRSEDETVAALEELEARGLLREDGEGYAFSHDSLRSVIYGDTSLARRRLLHRRAAESLAARPSRERVERAAVIAEHFRLAGRDAEAAEYHRLAGVRAHELLAPAEALAHFRSALALEHPDEAGLHEAIGGLLTLLGDYGQAIASLEAAAALASDPAQLGRIEHELGAVHHRRGEWELAAAQYEAAAAALAGDETGLARVEADRSLNEHRRGRAEAAVVLARHALELAERAGDTAALAQAHNILGILAGSRGERDEALVQLRRSLELAGGLADPGARVAALNNLALVERADGNLTEALALARQALELCAVQGDRHREAALHNNLADLLHGAGRAEEAMKHLKRAVAIFAEIGTGAGDLQPEIWKLVEW
jgi:DNA-binding SARP family transcriptional activator/Tfp pilus assembly protein PilF